ncbi:MAG: hypothetical protein HPY89_11135 [Pelotomaculum sp.]|nr:hypothetical protein [Pelotomaculum sp.]
MYQTNDYWTNADAAANGLVYDPYQGRYVEPWNACTCEEEAVASGAALGILAAMEFLWAAVVGIILLLSHIVLKIIEWDDMMQEYKRLHEKDPPGYQIDAHLKVRGNGVREKYVLTEWGLLTDDECQQRLDERRPRPLGTGTGERGRWQFEGGRLVEEKS